jgi:hypothetical protein
MMGPFKQMQLASQQRRNMPLFIVSYNKWQKKKKHHETLTIKKTTRKKIANSILVQRIGT